MNHEYWQGFTSSRKLLAVPGNSLTFFRVDGFYFDVEQPLPSGDTIAPVLDEISAYVDFFPGGMHNATTLGLQTIVTDLLHPDATHGDTEVAIAPITGRTINGSLCTVAIGDPKGVELLAYSAPVVLDEPLYYHVRFRNVTYGGAMQRLSNFAFLAPVDATPVNLTGSTLTRLPYAGP